MGKKKWKKQTHIQGRSRRNGRKLICSEEDEREEGLSRAKKK